MRYKDNPRCLLILYSIATLSSGTPLNTSFKDLVNQFKFLGIEDADEMIRAVGGTGGRRPTDPVAWKIQFLLGNIMMRHSQKQKYRGTETTLMSLPKKVSLSLLSLILCWQTLLNNHFCPRPDRASNQDLLCWRREARI